MWAMFLCNLDCCKLIQIFDLHNFCISARGKKGQELCSSTPQACSSCLIKAYFAHILSLCICHTFQIFTHFAYILHIYSLASQCKLPCVQCAPWLWDVVQYSTAMTGNWFAVGNPSALWCGEGLQRFCLVKWWEVRFLLWSAVAVSTHDVKYLAALSATWWGTFFWLMSDGVVWGLSNGILQWNCC